MIPNFAEMCSWARIGALAIAAFFLLLSIIVYFRGPRDSYYSHPRRSSKAVSLYLDHQSGYRTQLFWFLLFCGIISLSIGVIVPSAYISGNLARSKSVALAPEPNPVYSDYNAKIFYPVVLFLVSLAMFCASEVRAGTRAGHSLYIASKFFFFMGIFTMIFLIIGYPSVCELSPAAIAK